VRSIAIAVLDYCLSVSALSRELSHDKASPLGLHMHAGAAQALRIEAF